MALSEKYDAIHRWLAYNYPKTNRCERCGKEGRTDYAFIRWPNSHTHNRTDYEELCVSCHRKFDYATGQRKPSSYQIMLARKAAQNAP